MAGLSRYFVKGQSQHIIQRGNNRKLIFVMKMTINLIWNV